MPWRSRIRFSLLTLLVAVTGLCVWLGTIVDRAYRQKRGVERVEKLGGAAFFDFQRQSNQHAAPNQGILPSFDYTAPPPGSEWARRWLGEDYFRTTVCVRLWDARLTADDLQALVGLRDLAELQFHRVDFSTVNCQPLARLTELEKLVLNECVLGETSLAPIGRLARLRHLALTDMPLDDSQIPPLSGLISLEFLRLTGTKITGSSFGDLKNLTKFSTLFASGIPLDDRGMEAIGTLPAAENLRLDGTAITDHGLAHLARMTSLERLQLDRTAVTDRGLVHLAKLHSLEILTLTDTNIRGSAAALGRLHGLANLKHLLLSVVRGAETDQALARLRKALPDCAIRCDQRDAQEH